MRLELYKNVHFGIFVEIFAQFKLYTQVLKGGFLAESGIQSW